MLSPQLLYLVLALALVGANAFFVATEFALVKMRSTRLDELVREGNRAAVRTRDMVRHIDAYLSACQLGITLASLGLGWIGEPAFARVIGGFLTICGLHGYVWLPGLEAAGAFSLLTILHIVLGELAPKSVAIQYTEPVALWFSGPMQAFFRITAPVIHLLNWAGNRVVSLLGLPPPDLTHEGHSTSEIRLMLHESHRCGALDLTERQLLENAFEFSDRMVRQVMRPRGDCTYLSTAESLEKTMERVRQTGYTRYPLCKSDMDEVVGLIHVKDLLFPAEPLATSADLERLAREILFVPETVWVPRLLARMRQSKVLMAIAVDEYGVVSGLCTLEDILEELVGEIQDEHDQESPLIRPTPEGAFIVEGTTMISELSRRMMLDIKPFGGETVSGFVLSRLGRMAKEGDTLVVDNYRISVIEMKGLRLARLLFVPIAP